MKNAQNPIYLLCVCVRARFSQLFSYLSPGRLTLERQSSVGRHYDVEPSVVISGVHASVHVAIERLENETAESLLNSH